MDDDAEITTGPDRPEVQVLGILDPMKTQPGVRRIHLKIENCGLRGLLFLGRQLGQAPGECVGNAEVHELDLFSEDDNWNGGGLTQLCIITAPQTCKWWLLRVDPSAHRLLLLARRQLQEAVPGPGDFGFAKVEQVSQLERM